MMRRLWRATLASVIAGGVLLGIGCTRESTRVALAAQRRSDDVQRAVFERQHDALRVLMYRDLVRRLEQHGEALNSAQRAALSEIWNDRDLIEFWALQHERAAALRVMGVDAKLFADQSVVDLWWKQVASRTERGKAALKVHQAKKAAR
jgi:hypothetical protein